MGSIKNRQFATKMGDTVALRTARLDDAESLLAHIKAMLAEDAFTVTTAEEFERTIEQEREWIKAHATSSRKIALIAEDKEQRLIGLLAFQCGCCKRLAHRGTLHMSVAEPWRGCGVGSALLQSLIDWADAHPDIEKLCLAVLSNNGPAIGLYKKFGFTEEGRRPKEVKLGPDRYVDDILMYRFVSQQQSRRA